MISVMRNKFARSWPADGERIYAVDVGYGLLRSYKTDAHFVQYTSGHARRLSSASLEAGAVARMALIVLDVDCPLSHGGKAPTPDSWRAETLARALGMATAHPGMSYYETKGGCRIMYRLPCVAEISSRADAIQWSQDYAVTLAYINRRFGIVADKACADWQRCFRLPRATRDGVRETRPMYGDPRDMGALTFTPDAADIAAAKSSSKAFTAVAQHDFSVSSGEGILYHAVRNRGLLLRPRGRGIMIVCPRAASHSCGRPGDTSTILYGAASGKSLGAIHCMHAGCAGMTPASWLKEFSDAELERARRDAGLRARYER